MTKTKEKDTPKKKEKKDVSAGVGRDWEVENEKK